MMQAGARFDILHVPTDHVYLSLLSESSAVAGTTKHHLGRIRSVHKDRQSFGRHAIATLSLRCPR